VPEGVFPPTPVSDLLGREVLVRAATAERVLDMGCGAGANAILAARGATEVVGVDVNPVAVAAARANAARNEVEERARFAVSDLFDAVEGDFDLVVFDPPFRWFKPRDMFERAFADENYETLGRFMTELPARLRAGGQALVFFGSSGDVAYFDELTAAPGLEQQTVAERTRPVRGELATYFVRRLSARGRRADA
jgi:release factor glutamine methyltransferase